MHTPLVLFFSQMRLRVDELRHPPNVKVDDLFVVQKFFSRSVETVLTEDHDVTPLGVA
jgi:hypothetical protein